MKDALTLLGQLFVLAAVVGIAVGFASFLAQSNPLPPIAPKEPNTPEHNAAREARIAWATTWNYPEYSQSPLEQQEDDDET